MLFAKSNKEYYKILTDTMYKLEMPSTLEMLDILTEDGSLTYKEALVKLKSKEGTQLLENHTKLTNWLISKGLTNKATRLQAYQELIKETNKDGYSILQEKVDVDISDKESEETLDFLSYSVDKLIISDMVKYIKRITPENVFNKIEASGDLSKALLLIEK